MSKPTTTLWFYLKSATPIYTYTLPNKDHRLPLLLEDVRLVRHGSHIFIHLRSEFEWERALQYLGDAKAVKAAASTAA
ncbi:MAG: hypothetical protein ACO1OQ_09290 [Rufibacter sp.]